MRPTKNDIPAAKREKLATYLNQLLADAVDLKMQAKQAHWNVRGENFEELHLLFDKAAVEIEDTYDLLAERVVQLGGEALGTVRVVAKTSRLKEYKSGLESGQQHVDAFSSALADFNKRARKGIDDTDDLGDKVTADMLTGITRGFDKLLWMVEAHLKGR